MNNNVYIRNKTSIKSIMLTRMLFLLPLIIYGCYKNGIYLYIHKYVNLFNMFRPLIFIVTGAFIGLLVNLIYEKIIRKSKDRLIDIIFSSFHVEYGIVLACVCSINTNLFVFAIVTFFFFLISKFFKNRINIVALCFIIIYLLCTIKGNYIFANEYELSKTFRLNLFDYLIGRGPGGIAATHLILLGIALAGLHITSNNKTIISINAIIVYAVLATCFSIFTNHSILESLFFNNYFFIFSYIATDMVTSCYTNKGIMLFGILVGLLTFAFTFLNPIIAPFISILIVSLLNNLIDRKINKMEKIYRRAS